MTRKQEIVCADGRNLTARPLKAACAFGTLGSEQTSDTEGAVRPFRPIPLFDSFLMPEESIGADGRNRTSDLGLMKALL